MNDKSCSSWKDELPLYGAGRLDAGAVAALEEHVARCADCRAELEVIRALWATRPAVRVGLDSDVKAALRRRPAQVRPLRTWTWAAAATVVLALGTGVVWQRLTAPSQGSVFGEELVEAVFWPGDEELIAGAPVFSELTEAELTQLLEEWDEGSS